MTRLPAKDCGINGLEKWQVLEPDMDMGLGRLPQYRATICWVAADERINESTDQRCDMFVSDRGP